MKRKNAKKKIYTVFSTISLLLTIITNFIAISPFSQIGYAETGDISVAWNNETTLNVTVLAVHPKILWYDFQYWNYSNGWESKLNQQIDVNNSAKYRFILNLSSDQGFDDIQYINITAWYDQGNDTTIFNQTLGGNFNLNITYRNLTGSANVSMHWPHNEATFLGYNETVVIDRTGISGLTEARNISFEFIPNYQFRYAPGPSAGWNTTRTGRTSNYSWFNLRNPQSWNFNITVTDSGENNSNIPLTSYATDEFGVYSYSEIISVGWPVIKGNPGGNYSVNDAGGSGNITLITRSNGNYTLSVNLSDLQHGHVSSTTLSNETVYVRGGNRSIFKNFSHLSNAAPVYLYGGGINGMPSYQNASRNGSSVTSDDVEYKCDIPLGQLTGSYTSTIYYCLRTN